MSPMLTAASVGISSTVSVMVDRLRSATSYVLPKYKKVALRPRLIEQLRLATDSIAESLASPTLTRGAQQESNAEALLNHYLLISSSSLLIGVVGALVLPPLQLLALPGLL